MKTPLTILKGDIEVSLNRPRSAESPWIQSVRILTGNRMAMLGMVVILFWIVVATAAPVVLFVAPGPIEERQANVCIRFFILA